MIAFDTNVVVRLLVADDERQRAAAEQLLARAIGREERVLLPDLVLCELDWILRSSYRVPGPERLATLRELADDPTFAFEDPRRRRAAHDAVAAGRGELADHLLSLHARVADASTTYTFDRRLRDAPGFTVVA